MGRSVAGTSREARRLRPEPALKHSQVVAAEGVGRDQLVTAFEMYGAAPTGGALSHFLTCYALSCCPLRPVRVIFGHNDRPICSASKRAGHRGVRGRSGPVGLGHGGRWRHRDRSSTRIPHGAGPRVDAQSRRSRDARSGLVEVSTTALAALDVRADRESKRAERIGGSTVVTERVQPESGVGHEHELSRAEDHHVRQPAVWRFNGRCAGEGSTALLCGIRSSASGRTVLHAASGNERRLGPFAGHR